MAEEGEEGGPKMMRPNDLSTAAYYGDIKKIKELLTVPAVDEEPPIDPEFDPMAEPDLEAEEAAVDRAQKRAENAADIQKKLHTAGPLLTRLSPVNIQEYGFGYQIKENDLRLSVKFKPSKSCPDVAAPLHWAVLGKEHEVIEHLILEGADPNHKTPELGVTIFDVISKNQLVESGIVVQRAIEGRAAKVAAEKKKVDDRHAVQNERRLQREAALDEQKKKEEDEKRQAEEEEAEAARLEAEANAEQEGGGAEAAVEEAEDEEA